MTAAALPLALALLTPPTRPSLIEHAPPGPALRREALALAVRLRGIPGEPEVIARYRPHGAAKFAALKLARRGPEVYEGAIPGSATRGYQVSYYLTVTAERQVHQLGSAEVPLVLRLEDAPAASGSAGAGTALAASSLAIAGAALTVREVRRRRRRAALVRGFWVRTLFPLTHLQGARLEEQLRVLAATPLDHPSEGLRTYPAPVLERKLEQIRGLDVGTLVHYGSEAASRTSA